MEKTKGKNFKLFGAFVLAITFMFAALLFPAKLNRSVYATDSNCYWLCYSIFILK